METKPQSESADTQSLYEYLDTLFVLEAAPGEWARDHTAYRRSVKLFSDSLGRPANLSDLVPDQVEAFANSLAGSKSKSYKNHIIRCLRAIWRFAADQGLAQPIVEPKREIEREMTPGTVSHFLETEFIPVKAAGKPASYLATYRRSVQLFSDFLGRPAELSDLGPDQVEALAESLAGAKTDRYKDLVKARLRLIWRYAAAQGLAAEFNVRPREMTPGTVSQFLETDFIPGKAASKSPGYHNLFRQAVDSFSEFLERPALLSDLTPEQVKRFAEWLITRSQSHRLKRCLRSVWRFAAAQGLAEPIDDPAREMTPGTVSHFLETEFIPGKATASSSSYRSHCRQAVSTFSEFLERPALLSDLTIDQATWFAEWLIRNGRLQQMKSCLRTVWRFAAARGLAEPIDNPTREATRDMTPGTVSHFLETEFIPGKAAGKTSGYHSLCRRAVNLFSEFLERPALLTDLTPENVERYTHWVRSVSTKRLWTQLRSIWRFAAARGLARNVNETYRNPGALEPVLTPGTLSHFFETVYLPQRLVGASTSAVGNYRSKIHQLSKFVGHPVTLAELCDALLASFLNERLKSGLRKSSVNGVRGDIATVWRFAHEQGLVATKPGVRKLRAEHDEPDSWSEDEFRRLLARCDCLETHSPYSGVPAASLMRAVLLLAYWTGLRRGTLWKIKWSEVDLEGRWVTVPGNSMKGRRGKKFRIGEDAAAALQAVQIRGAVTVLPELDWKRFYRDFDVVLEAAGIPPSTRKRMTKLHKIRRTTATMVAVRQGLGAASSLLGHSSEQITLRYIDPSKLAGNDMTDVLPSLTLSAGGVS